MGGAGRGVILKPTDEEIGQALKQLAASRMSRAQETLELWAAYRPLAMQEDFHRMLLAGLLLDPPVQERLLKVLAKIQIPRRVAMRMRNEKTS